MTKITINGFGRIGRNIARLLFSDAYKNHGIELVAINDLTDTATLAHLFKYDSVHGRFNGEVTCSEKSITINGKTISITAEKDPTKLPWKSQGVEFVHECTGIFTKKEKAGAHIEAGAKKVIISAPATDPDITICFGVNHTEYKASDHHIISNASCTTNCLAPMAKVIQENFGIVKGTMTTIHSYTNDQQILDLPHKDLRRARAAAMSMIPTTTGAAKAVGLVIPALKGKVDGYAVRVPTCDVSIVDFVCELERETTAADINRALQTASNGAMKGVLGFSEEPLVSVDYIGNTASSTIDAALTMVIGGKMAKVVSWYDNEMGFSARMLDVTKFMNS
jgi:glyceraldehyde 3-phosphate dehydrogenase